eukprot:TRINITY_DN9806_c0_g1_i1.p1 TRINITY_DN9806_c0_g1~~TRINITY_DN9806_c0_g1_i1.p1  ORF type:complete len:974 (+),score=343.89 TRINITY_DN9806_c0_g1_i1:61-2922(+)
MADTPPLSGAPPRPSRTVLVVGGESSGALELTKALTGRRHQAFPYVYSAKIMSAEGMVQADMVLHHKTSINVPKAAGEPEAWDAVVCCYDVFAQDSITPLEIAQDKLADAKAPKVVVGLGMEKYMPPSPSAELTGGEDSDKKEKTEQRFSKPYNGAAGLCGSLGAKVFYEISTKHKQAVREVFTTVLRAALDPDSVADEPVVTADGVTYARERYTDELKEAGLGATFEEKPPEAESSRADDYLKRKTKGKDGETKAYYQNVVTGVKVRNLPEEGRVVELNDDKIKQKIMEVRDKYVPKAQEERLAAVRTHEAKQAAAFEASMVRLVQEKESLLRTVAILQKEADEDEHEWKDNDKRYEKLMQQKKDSKQVKEDMIYTRVKEEVDHEKQMQILRRRHDELVAEQLAASAAGEKKSQESCEAIISENRRAMSQLESLMRDGKAVREKIRTVERETKKVRNELDAEEQRLAGDARMRAAQKEEQELKEEITQLRRQQDEHTDDLILHRGAQAKITYQLREWKRERKVLLGMLVEIKEKIANQEVPITQFLADEKRRARQRGGMLVLDEDDEHLMRSRKHKAGDYKAPSNKQLMAKLHTEHDRLSLEYQFFCKDLGEAVAACDDLNEQLHLASAQHHDSIERVAEARTEVGVSLHKLLLVLEELSVTRRRALSKLELKEDDAARSLMRIQEALDNLLAQHAGIAAQHRIASHSASTAHTHSTRPPSAEAVYLEQEIARARKALYTQTLECERVAGLRREQHKAFKAVTLERENIDERIKVCEMNAEHDETATAQLTADVQQLLSVISKAVNATGDADSAAPTRHPLANGRSASASAAGATQKSFLGRALATLHEDTKALIAKRCGVAAKDPAPVPAVEPILGRRGAKPASGTRLPLSQLPASQPEAPRASVSDPAGRKAPGRAKNDYNTLVDSLRQEFGMGGKKRVGKREGDWRNVW